MAKGETLKKGDRVYAVCMSKMLALFRIGEEPVSAGMNILGAHIDSPRIDVKQNPLYENEGLAYLDTHYYGGIKNISGGAPSCSSWCCCEERRHCHKSKYRRRRGDPVL